MRIVSVVGARPQFVKAAVVSRAIRKVAEEILVHTGQHYDEAMSRAFFEDLGIPEPDVNLEVGSGSHARQTAGMLTGLEEVLVAKRPDRVVVYGDTNSTLAGCLAAAKLGIPVAHVEAGLRSFNRRMPEEINRVVVDHLAELLLCPSEPAAAHLRCEGIVSGVHVVGDVMADALELACARPERADRLLEQLGLAPREYLLATVHRAENTDDPARLNGILGGLGAAGLPVILPLHPRTRDTLGAVRSLVVPRTVRMIEPLGYLDMIALAKHARMVLTDSGGVQKEAYWLGVPCLTLRDETEWVETVEAGWNRLVGADSRAIRAGIEQFVPPAARPSLYGDGRAAERCAVLIAG